MLYYYRPCLLLPFRIQAEVSCAILLSTVYAELPREGAGICPGQARDMAGPSPDCCLTVIVDKKIIGLPVSFLIGTAPDGPSWACSGRCMPSMLLVRRLVRHALTGPFGLIESIDGSGGEGGARSSAGALRPCRTSTSVAPLAGSSFIACLASAMASCGRRTVRCLSASAVGHVGFMVVIAAGAVAVMCAVSTLRRRLLSAACCGRAIKACYGFSGFFVCGTLRKARSSRRCGGSAVVGRAFSCLACLGCGIARGRVVVISSCGRTTGSRLAFIGPRPLYVGLGLGAVGRFLAYP